MYNYREGDRVQCNSYGGQGACAPRNSIEGC